ncbi:MAG: hypothetical protein HZB42_09430 [Sphingobacteriales bacterium]|nr:hypothetical protein [Sphingobacteriales bacterium]
MAYTKGTFRLLPEHFLYTLHAFSMLSPCFLHALSMFNACRKQMETTSNSDIIEVEGGRVGMGIGQWAALGE